MKRKTMEREMVVATRDEVPTGTARGFRLGGRDIVLCDVDGEIYALEGMCTHQDLPLDGGEVEDGVLTCDWHGAQFDVCSGRATALPAVRGLRQYATRIDEDGRILVTLPE
jgi:3-phenylpropionate/trans-cinnamate dioxygenase ferredoxin component